METPHGNEQKMLLCVGGGSVGIWRVCVFEGNTKSKYLARWDSAWMTESAEKPVSASLGHKQNRAPYRGCLGGAIM